MSVKSRRGTVFRRSLVFVWITLTSLTFVPAGTAWQIPPSQELAKPSLHTPAEISNVQAKAQAGDATAQVILGKAYRDGNGVPQNDVLAAKWFRSAADLGDPIGENEIGLMFQMGYGVPKMREEAIRWYAKAAKQGNAQAMFNLGASYYNGDGVASDPYAAYAWFLLAQEAGDTAAEDAVKRSAHSISTKETADTFFFIGEMYGKGEEIKQNQERAIAWMRRAADIDPAAKIKLAGQLVSGPGGAEKSVEAFELCKEAAKDYPAGATCVGYMYRKGVGVRQDSAEAFKWYLKAADAGRQTAAMIPLAEMYENGEGTKVDRAAAFIWLIRGSNAGAKGAKEKASQLLSRMSQSEIKHTQDKLRGMRIDPKILFAQLKAVPVS